MTTDRFYRAVNAFWLVADRAIAYVYNRGLERARRDK